MHLVMTHPLLPGRRGAKIRVTLTLASASGSLQAAAENALGGRRVHLTSGYAGLLQAERLPGGGGHQRAYFAPDIRAPQRYNESLPSLCQGRRPQRTQLSISVCGGKLQAGRRPSGGRRWRAPTTRRETSQGLRKEGAPCTWRGQLACRSEMQGVALC